MITLLMFAVLISSKTFAGPPLGNPSLINIISCTPCTASASFNPNEVFVTPFALKFSTNILAVVLEELLATTRLFDCF